MASWCFMKHQENGLATQTLKRQSYTLLGFRPCFWGLPTKIPPFLPPFCRGFR